MNKDFKAFVIKKKKFITLVKYTGLLLAGGIAFPAITLVKYQKY